VYILRCTRHMRRRSKRVFVELTGIVSCAVGVVNSAPQEEHRSNPYPEDLPAARMVVDPYPALNGIAVDPQNDVVIASDPNRKSLLLYDRSGNAAPKRVLSVPHQAWGLALGESTDELAVTAEIFNAVVFYRREAKGVEAPVRVIRGPKTRLADPHGVYWDDANGEIGVASHGNFRGVIHNTGAGCAPGPLSAKSESAKLETANSESSKSESPKSEAAEEGGEFRPPSIAIFSATAKDDQAPLRTIEGDATKLDWPMGIAEDSAHNSIVVANNGDNSVLVFDRQ